MSPEVKGKEFKRLPTSVVPINYALILKPDLKSFTFSGTETINVNVNEETKHILLNLSESEINSALFTSGDGKSTKQLFHIKKSFFFEEIYSIILFQL